MALILSLDTSTEACSVAVNNNGEVHEIFEVIPRQHSQQLFLMIDQLLASCGVQRNQIDAIAFGRGPGAFTGVRIATGVAQGLGWALDCPVVPVSTLAALAQQGLREHQAEQVIATIDARMDEVYLGFYQAENGLMVPAAEECVCPPEQVAERVPAGFQPQLGMGTGWVYGDRLNMAALPVHETTYPHAYDIAVLAAVAFEAGQGVPAEQALPVYLRDKVALKKSER